MKALALRIYVLTALLAAILCPPLRVQAADCAALQQKRSEVFRSHASTVSSLGLLRSQIAELGTQDPAVINKRLNQASNAAASAYRHVQFTTGSEQAAWKNIYAGAERYVDYWRAKKANEISGGMIDLPSVDNFRAFTNQRIAIVEKREQQEEREISDLDKQIKQCASSHGGSARSHSNWSGTYVSGSYVIVISGGFGSLSYTADRNDGDTTDHTSGTCTVKGTEATCKDKGKYHDSDKDVERESVVTLTLSGNTIYAKSRVTSATVTLASGQPCPDPAQCTGLHAGAEFEGTWTKKP